MLGSSKMSVGGLGIDAKVEERLKIIFKKLFFEFSRRGGHNFSWRAHLLGWGDEMEGEM
jgi:hypothetical protein